jgi:hypothetical protein
MLLAAPRLPSRTARGHPLTRSTPDAIADVPAVGQADPELIALPAPPRRDRTATLVLMAATALAALGMCGALAGEALYATTPGRPVEVADLAALDPGDDLANRYVRGHALLGTAGAVKYGRPAEGDSFRLAPVAGNARIWVEIRVPEGFEGPRFVPPSTFAGRLVPLDDAGIRHAGLRRAVAERGGGGASMPEGAWLLVDGNSPRASRWALALVVLLLGFAGWNLVGIARLLRRVRDAGPPAGPAPSSDQA